MRWLDWLERTSHGQKVVHVKDVNSEKHRQNDTKIDDDGIGSFTVVNYTVNSSNPIGRTVTFAVISEHVGS